MNILFKDIKKIYKQNELQDLIISKIKNRENQDFIINSNKIENFTNKKKDDIIN